MTDSLRVAVTDAVRDAVPAVGYLGHVLRQAFKSIGDF